ncbi:MAG: hypothetical protein KC613_25930 [Myxococcales bacterium]|nr:hypothetical protein [Myxococcales bacterium]
MSGLGAALLGPVCLSAACLLTPDAHADPRIRAETGAGYDSNITRAEDDDARRAGALLRAVLDLDDQARLGSALGVGVSYQAGAKHFFDAPGEDVVFQRLSGWLSGRLSPAAGLGLRLGVQDRTTRDPLRPRDYTRLSAGPEVTFALGALRLGAQAGVERLQFKSDTDFSADGYRAGLSAQLGQGTWIVDGQVGLMARAFDGTRLVVLGPDDPVERVLFVDPVTRRDIGFDPGDVSRHDTVWTAGLRLRHVGTALASLEYSFALNDSDSYNGRFTRHEVQASVTTPLFAGLLLSAKASLQRLTYADGVYLSPLEVLDDENRSALSARLEWPLWEAVSLVASGGSWFSPFGGGADFQRHVGVLGLALNDG